MGDLKSPERELADSQVIAAIRAGNSALYGVLSQRYSRLLIRTAGSVLRRGEEVDDVLQEAHFRALTHIADFRGPSSFSAWLTRIARNEALTCLRRRSRFVDASQLGDEGNDVIALVQSMSPSPERQAMHRELRFALREAVGSLPPIYRVVFVLKEIEELSTADIVVRLGITRAAVKGRLYRARKALRAKLRAWQGPDARVRVRQGQRAWPENRGRCCKTSHRVAERAPRPGTEAHLSLPSG